MATPTDARTDLQPLVAAQGAARDALTLQAVAIATAATRDFDGWYEPDRISKWAAALAKAIEPLLRLLARNTDAYAARSVRTVAGGSFRPVGAIDVRALRNGLTNADAFARAANVYRYQQSKFDAVARKIDAAVTLDRSDKAVVESDALLEPVDLIDAMEAALARVVAVMETNADLAVRDQAAKTLQAAERRGLITGWRRILHPELSKGGSCGLCVAASTRVYRVEELMPIHDRCKCVPAAVRGDDDPGSVLNEDDLKRVYADAGGSTLREDLKRTRYRIDEHGELGPVISDGNAKPRTSQRAKREERIKSSKPAKTAEQTRADLQNLHDEMKRILPKAEALNKDDPKKWGAYYQKLEARVADLARQLAT